MKTSCLMVTCQGRDHIVNIRSGCRSPLVVNVHSELELTWRSPRERLRLAIGVVVGDFNICEGTLMRIRQKCFDPNELLRVHRLSLASFTRESLAERCRNWKSPLDKCLGKVQAWASAPSAPKCSAFKTNLAMRIFWYNLSSVLKVRDTTIMRLRSENS